jgi:hypothetical protein
MGPPGATGATGAAGAQGVPGQPGPAGNRYGEEAASFIGFTTATTAGNVGSREGMHAICAAQFPGSHLCHMSEYALATPATPVPAAGAWTDLSGYAGASASELTNQVGTTLTGRYAGPDYVYNCMNWTVTTNTGLVAQPAGPATASCSSALPLACCVTPYREKFVGLAGSVTGNQGGREQMHALCAAQYAGAHMCHFAEYYRAASPVALPAGGAWADLSGYTGGSASELTLEIAPVNVGRYYGPDYVYNCMNWTVTTNTGLTLGPAGAGTASCSTTRPVACCN